MNAANAIVALGLEMEWPSAIRAPLFIDRAKRVAQDAGLEAGIAFLGIAWLSEWEFSDGRGGEPLTLDELLDQLESDIALNTA